MCGIAGWVAARPASTIRGDVAAMLDALAHRGPDGAGDLARDIAGHGVVLGHRRLRIIDLSAAAAQPMSSEDGRHHVILNGEIVNYVELRDELRARGVRFRSASDTEVLLEAWRAWGPESLLRLEGMFAFALLDEAREELVLARDPFGIKPIYYTVAGGALAFASEIPPLLTLPGVSRRVAPAPLGEFLRQSVNALPGTTLFADVFEIPPAHVARVALREPTRVEPAVYWTPPTRERAPLSFDAAAGELRERLAERVRRHLRADVPVGLMLSGGMDSSSVLMLTRQALGPDAPIHTFSYRGSDGAADEGRFQAAAREAAGAIAHDVRIAPEEWSRDLAALIRAQGEPFASPVVYAQRRLFQAASAEGVKVVLDGQGSDEILAGYGYFSSGRVASLLRAGRLVAAGRMLAAHTATGDAWRTTLRGAVGLAWPVVRSLAGSAPQHGLADPAWLAARDASPPPPWTAEGPEVLRAMLARAVHAPSIPWLMRYADRNAMAFSIENRVPFLDRPFVDWVLGLPEAHFIRDDGRGKAILRAAMRGLVPDVVIDRTDKVGFDVPVETWVQRTPGLRDLLAEGAALPPIHQPSARHLLASIGRGDTLTRAQAFGAWRLVTLASWQREFRVTFD